MVNKVKPKKVNKPMSNKMDGDSLGIRVFGKKKTLFTVALFLALNRIILLENAFDNKVNYQL
jgi:hypothetical protein